MKQLPSVEYLRECLVCNPIAGTLHWRERPRDHFQTKRAWAIANANFAGKEAGTINAKGYRYVHISLDGERHLIAAHRIIWVMTTGEWPANEIDHLDGNTGANRFDNLREATRAENNRNCRVQHQSRLGLKGVRARGQNFTAQIQIDGKIAHLGTFDTPERAHEAYKLAAVQHHGAFARW